MKTTEKVIIRRAAIIDRNREYTFNYLNEHPCVDCGESRILALDFDHVRGLKEYDICEMVRYGMSLKRIKNEVSKCDIRCSNCHRIKTANQFGWAKTLFIPKPTAITPIVNKRTLPNIVERFWKKVPTTKNDQSCWLWNNGKSKNKGTFRISYYLGVTSPHKYAYEITYGEVPPDKLVCHTCTNDLCCNPKHLFLGTRKDCAISRELKHRGESKSNHKLTLEQVREIKQANGSINSIAKQYKVSRATITNIKTGKTWSYVT
jgi:hypothetical protein